MKTHTQENFDYVSYAENYPDICVAFKIRYAKGYPRNRVNVEDATKNREQLFRHFLNHGQKEGRTDDKVESINL